MLDAENTGKCPRAEGVTQLREAIGKEKRPLSWAVGPQGVFRPEMPSQRDEKRDERMKATELRPVNEI